MPLNGYPVRFTPGSADLHYPDPHVAGVTVRAATLEDVEFLSQLMWIGYRVDHPGAADRAPAAWIEGARVETREQVRGRVVGSSTSVIEVGGERVGRLRVVREAERLFLAGIQILAEHRGRGIGAEVIGRLLDEARGVGVPVDLTVSRHNPDAERLYTRLGFRRVGEDGSDYLMRASSRVR